MKNFSLTSLVSGFVLGVLFIGGWYTINDSSFSILSASHPLTPSQDTSLPKSGALFVMNQSAGSEVTIESLTVPPPGVWVAVREVNGIELGNVLGAGRVNGPRSKITIPLLRATEPRQQYAVELYRDDGNGVFDLSTDSVYVDFATGAPVIEYFSTN